MKMLKTLRKRGFTLIEITLVLAVGLGLIVGGLMFFQQAQASSEVTDKTRAIVSISSEVRAQFRTAPDYAGINATAVSATTPVAGGVTATGTTGAAIFATNFGTRSGLPVATFNDLTGIEGSGQTFTITMGNLTEGVCERLAIADLGPKSTADAADCENGNLEVSYTR